MNLDGILLFPNINTYFIDFMDSRTGAMATGVIDALSEQDAIDRWVTRYGNRTDYIAQIEDAGCNYTNFQRALDIVTGKRRIDEITGLEL